MKEFYETRKPMEHEYWELLRINKVLEKIPKNKKVLDIGCNDGTITKRIKVERNADVVGVDISKKMLAKAKKKKLKTCFADAQKKLPFKNNEFDVAVSQEVIEHLIDPAKFLSEVKKILKPNGVFIITTPNLAALKDRIYLLTGKQPTHVETELKGGAGHVRAYTPSAFIQLLDKYGFKITKKDGDFVRLPIPGKPGYCSWLGTLFPNFSHCMILTCKLK